MEGGIPKDDVVSLCIHGGMPSWWSMLDTKCIHKAQINDTKELVLSLINGLGQMASFEIRPYMEAQRYRESVRNKAANAILTSIVVAAEWLDEDRLRLLQKQIEELLS